MFVFGCETGESCREGCCLGVVFLEPGLGDTFLDPVWGLGVVFLDPVSGLGVGFLDPGLGVPFLDPPPSLGVVPREGRSGSTLTPNGVGGLSDSLELLEQLELLLVLLGITKSSILARVKGIV